MFAYLIIGITPLFFAVLLRNYKHNSNRSLYLAVIGTVLVLFSGLRGDFCADYRNYYDFFLVINTNYSFNDIWEKTFYNEKGFIFFNKIVGMFTKEPKVFIFILSLLIIFFFFVILNKYSESAWLSVILFVGIGSFYDSFNVTRQILAASIAFLGAKYLFEKRFWKYCIVIAVSSLFHRTAILLIPLYYVLVGKINRKKITMFLVCGIVAYISLPRLIDIVKIILPAYQNYDLFSGGGNIKWLILPMSLLIFTVVVIELKKVDEEVLNSPVMNVSLNALILYVLFVIVGMQSQMVVRMATFMQPYTLLLIPNLLMHYKGNRERQVIISVIIILAVLYPMITLSGTGYDPYYSIWS